MDEKQKTYHSSLSCWKRWGCICVPWPVSSSSSMARQRANSCVFVEAIEVIDRGECLKVGLIRSNWKETRMSINKKGVHGGGWLSNDWEKIIDWGFGKRVLFFFDRRSLDSESGAGDDRAMIVESSRPLSLTWRFWGRGKRNKSKAERKSKHLLARTHQNAYLHPKALYPPFSKKLVLNLGLFQIIIIITIYTIYLKKKN